MQEYAAAREKAFAESRKCFGELEDWLASPETAGLQHGDLEEQLDVRGRELLRRLFQDRLDLTAAREERRHDVAGEDGVVRTRAERGRERPLATKFGQVTVSRIAYRSPGLANVHPLDAVLNLPEEKYSHGLRKLGVIEAVRGSYEAQAAAITRATGVKIGKRQAEELVLRAAADVDTFCQDRRPGACRHIVKDRMDITGARWGLEGAEAILKLRALIASGDFDEYWRFRLRREHERIHHAKYRETYALAA